MAAYDLRPLACRAGRHVMRFTGRTKVRGQGDHRLWYLRKCIWCPVTGWALRAND